MYKKILLSAVIIMAFTVTPALAVKNYNSAKSNTSSIAQVNQHIGNILLRYNVGGAEINKVTNALAVGIIDSDLKALLIRIRLSEVGIREIFVELDRLGVGINEEGLQKVLSPDTKDIAPSIFKVNTVETLPTPLPDGQIETTPTPTLRSTSDVELRTREIFRTGTIKIITPERSVSSDKEELVHVIQQGSGDPLKGLNICRHFPPGKCSEKGISILLHDYTKIEEERRVLHDTQINIIESIRSATPEDRENLLSELKTNRKTFQSEIVSMSLKIHENAQELRENFRENVTSVIGHVDHGKTARIAVAHGRSLRMLNRFRSAMARFNHILGRIESRALKLDARGIDISSIIPGIEEAKNISLENETHMEQLKATYELLLLGENPRGIAEDARTIAEDLKTKINKLHIRISTITTEMVSLDLRGVGINEEGLN